MFRDSTPPEFKILAVLQRTVVFTFERLFAYQLHLEKSPDTFQASISNFGTVQCFPRENQLPIT